jgi:hypothetical protein
LSSAQARTLQQIAFDELAVSTSVTPNPAPPGSANPQRCKAR